MAKKESANIINVIDAGTSKVCALIASVDEQLEIDILGMGESESDGMRKGVVTDLERMNKSIYRAVSAAEKMADRPVESAFVGISGAHLASTPGHGVISVADPHCIAADDMRRALEATRVRDLPHDREIIDIFQQEYAVDGQDGVRDPKGMSGSRLDVRVQVVSGASAPIHNLVKCICKLDITVSGLIPSAMASGMAALNDDERGIGVVVIDIGGGVTDIAVFQNGMLRRACVLPVGGDHVDNDLAVGLSTSISEARRVKLKHGNAWFENEDEGEPVELRLVGREEMSQVPRGLLCEIIHPRVRELFEIVRKDLEDNEDSFMAVPGGVALCGGAAKMPGVAQVAEKVLNTHIRIAAPRGVRANCERVAGPEYATAVGLVRCAAFKTPQAVVQSHTASRFSKILKPVSRLFRGMFS